MRILPVAAVDWILMFFAAGTFLLFSIALSGFYLEDGVPNRKALAFHDFVVAAAVIDMVSIILRGSTSVEWGVAGIVLCFLGASVFLSVIETARRVRLPRAFSTEPRPTRLLTTGPYRLVRHPMYVAYCLAFAAAPVATHGVIAIGAFVLLGVFFVMSALQEEAALAEQFGAEYQAYRARTGMFIPRFWSR